MESASDWPVGGLLSHAAGESPSGFRVIDVWESQDACDAFGQHLGPILNEVGITDPPEMYRRRFSLRASGAVRKSSGLCEGGWQGAAK